MNIKENRKAVRIETTASKYLKRKFIEVCKEKKVSPSAMLRNYMRTEVNNNLKHTS